MHGDTETDVSEPPDGGSPPEAIHDRRSEWESITPLISEPGSGNLHFHGPRGTGKSVLAQRAIEALPPTVTACYIPCTVYATQYQVLGKLYEELTDEKMTGGYHTSQLQLELSDLIKGLDIVIILDEVDFLLLNDGSDLLYYLTRIGSSSMSIVTISANYANLSTVVDERTYSSLLPQSVVFEPYTARQAARIISRRSHHALHEMNASRRALKEITSETTNIRHGLHWLAAALKQAGDGLTEKAVVDMRMSAFNSYWDSLLADFTEHHRLLLDSIKEIAEDGNQVRAGQVYENYGSLCQRMENASLTHRRISDFMKHLELLGVIEADYYYGGSEGKTRKIQLRRF